MKFLLLFFMIRFNSFFAPCFISCSLMFLSFACFLSIQAVLKQFGAGGYGGSDNMVTDEVELQQHQKLEKLYISTRAGKVTWFFCTYPLFLFVFYLHLCSPCLADNEIYCFSALSKGYCPWCGRLYCNWIQASWNRSVILVGEIFFAVIYGIYCMS